MHVGIVRSKSDGRGAMTYETSTMNIEAGGGGAPAKRGAATAAIRVSALRRAFLIPRARDAPFVVTVDDDATMSAHAGDDIAWTRQEASSRAAGGNVWRFTGDQRRPTSRRRRVAPSRRTTPRACNYSRSRRNSNSRVRRRSPIWRIYAPRMRRNYRRRETSTGFENPS